MPYYGYNGEEIEDPEMDEMRRGTQVSQPREGATSGIAGEYAEWASQVNATLVALERRVAQLEAQLDAATERLETRLEGLSDRLEGRIERTSRDLEGRIYDVERRLERSR